MREFGDSYTEDSSDFQGRRTARRLFSQTGQYHPGGEGRMLPQANNRLLDRDHLHGIYPDREESLRQKYRNQEANPAYVGATMWTGIDSCGYGSKVSLTGIGDPYLELKGVKTSPFPVHRQLLDRRGAGIGQDKI